MQTLDITSRLYRIQVNGLNEWWFVQGIWDSPDHLANLWRAPSEFLHGKCSEERSLGGFLFSS